MNKEAAILATKVTVTMLAIIGATFPIAMACTYLANKYGPQYAFGLLFFLVAAGSWIGTYLAERKLP